MRVRRVLWPEQVEAVRKGICEIIDEHALNFVLYKTLRGREIYIVGGAVRDPLVKLAHGSALITPDIDILVNDMDGFDVEKALGVTGRNYVNSFGSIRWKPNPQLTVDVIPFSKMNAARSGEPSLELFLQTCDLTTSAVAYDPRAHILYDLAAVQGINKREVDVMGGGDRPSISMAKLVLHADKLSFDIGPKGRMLIKLCYEPRMDEEIGRYLENKGHSEQFDSMTERLRLIAGVPQPNSLAYAQRF